MSQKSKKNLVNFSTKFVWMFFWGVWGVCASNRESDRAFKGAIARPIAILYIAQDYYSKYFMMAGQAFGHLSCSAKNKKNKKL